MPEGRAIKSPKQYGLMQAAAHGNLRGKGPSPEVAEKLIHETSPARRSRLAEELAAMQPDQKRRKRRK